MLKTISALNDFLRTMPYVRRLEIEVLEIKENGLLCFMPFRDYLVGNPYLPAIHGGAIASFLETSAIATANWSADRLGQSDIALPISVTFDYLRSAAAEDLFAQAHIVKQGRRLAQISCLAYQRDADKPVTALHASFSMTRAKS